MKTTRKPFSVAATLAAWDDGRLLALLQRRPDLAQPPPRNFAALADRSASAQSAQAAYRAVDRGAQQVAEALCLLPHPASIAQLAALLGPHVEPTDLDRPLATLGAVALAFRSGDEVHLNPGLSSFPYPGGLGPPAAVGLNRHTTSQLADIARRLGAKPGPTKASAVAAISAVLADPKQARAVVAKGPPGTADLAERIARLGPEVAVQGGAFGLNDRSPVGWLANRGMLAALSWDRLLMPRETGLALRGGCVFGDFSATPPPLPTTSVDAGQADAMGVERALKLVADVAAVLESCSAQPAKRLKEGGIGIRDVRRAAKLMERDERDAARIVDLAAAAGLVAMDHRADAGLPTPAYDEWLALEPPLRWGHLVTAWLSADMHPSLAGAMSVKDKPIPPLLARTYEEDAPPRRRIVLDAMADVPAGSATDAESLSVRARWETPDIWGGGPASPGTLVGWVVEEAELLGVWASGSLTTAGRAAVAGQRDEAVSAVAQRAPASVSEFVVQADLTAMAAGVLAPAVAAEMELLADVESRGAATVYRFTDATLRRALDAGRSAGEIQAFLERHSSRGVPQPLAYLVADLGRRHGQARVGTARSYLRSDDPSLLAELARARGLGSLRLRRLAPTVLVSDAEPAAVLASVRKAGYLPAEEDATGAVVVARPAARRTVPPPASPMRREPVAAPWDGGRPDPAAVVRGLRQGPAPSPLPPNPAAKPPPKPVRPAPPPPSTPLPFDGLRPPAIAKDPASVRALLAEACDEEWMVRLSYTNGKGVASQLNVVPIDVADGRLLAESLPRWDRRELNLERVHWARILTEAEEDQFL